MNLVLLFETDFVTTDAGEGDGRVRLTGRRAAHVQSIHRAAVGDTLCVGLVGGAIGRGEITHIDEQAVDLDVRLERSPPPALPLTLVMALPRPLVLKRVLITATAMGCKRIFLIQANRVERSFWNSKVLREGNLEAPLILGLEQAVDTLMPRVELRTRFKPFVEDELPELVSGTSGLVAHPEGHRPCPRGVEGGVTLVMGPEGGFVPFEIERLEAAGCSGVHLGERILRVEAALPALLARLF
ncbi:MAG: 16S rRNA (uracil(1498)-N(3))-methyltransferase [bacterium]|nr:16S rRNA (uracil(1498)-N(3))-methyltransferase [bacterium]